MLNNPPSLLDLKSYSSHQIYSFFTEVAELKRAPRPRVSTGERVALLFFEPSTRTRMSFESAAHRVGLGPLVFDGGANTSLEKGETVEDSILNISAMEPKLLVVRCGGEIDLNRVAQKLEAPIINAGWGVKGHPTQALLDLYTLYENYGNLKGHRLLIIGDIRHSRVAASHFEVMQAAGLEIAICGPEQFLVKVPNVRHFSDLHEGLVWTNSVMALRVQFERHEDEQLPGKSRENVNREAYRKSYGLNSEVLKILSRDGIIMHPGPINHGLELESEVLADSRSRVLQQVKNGVYVRELILRNFYGS